MADFNLFRFEHAQQSTYAQARRELQTGEKRSHWMWFIFPQIYGLGSSAMAQRYAISGIDEARAYLAHPVLGPRLRKCTELVNAVNGRSIEEIFGYPDNLKFHSSITLFAAVDESEKSAFAESLRIYFGGRGDEATLARLH